MEKKTSNNILIQLVDEHDLSLMDNEIKILKENTNTDFKLVALQVDSWNDDLSPWKEKAIIGKEDFNGNADSTLLKIKSFCNIPNKAYFLGGYSLSSLFSLWSGYQTNLFSGIAAISPSVWFPKFIDYMKDNTPLCKNIYLSLGNKEHKSKNKILASVLANINEAHKVLLNKKINSYLEFNEGNHFVDSDLRIAKGFAYLLNNK